MAPASTNNSFSGIGHIVRADASAVRDLVGAAMSILSRHLFIDPSELLANITMATKDDCGKYTWIVLKKELHSTLARRVFGLRSEVAQPTFDEPTFKEALFSFLLNTLNGKVAADFFDKKKIEANNNRANRERKRLTRKRSRAAKRERDREEKKVVAGKDDAATLKQSSDKPSTRSCYVCNRRFSSRKRASRHKCPGPPEVKKPQEQVIKASPAKRARRARARKAKAARAKAAKQAGKGKEVVGEEKSEPAADVSKLPGSSAVTASSRTQPKQKKAREECEACEEVAVGYKVSAGGGIYPKCRYHSDDIAHQSNFFYYSSSDSGSSDAED
ncbi:hypothetical protein FRC03_005925 [Tulasnella sp. 419]|nr:hypothetical protein FRC03_005925 [Tulasnella sp. 419]